jgi:NADH:ubiquinone oxidoreductase subunit F (NADH-binding)
MRGDPHKLVEGCLVAGRAMNATAGEQECPSNPCLDC